MHFASHKIKTPTHKNNRDKTRPSYLEAAGLWVLDFFRIEKPYTMLHSHCIRKFASLNASMRIRFLKSLLFNTRIHLKAAQSAIAKESRLHVCTSLSLSLSPSLQSFLESINHVLAVSFWLFDDQICEIQPASK